MALTSAHERTLSEPKWVAAWMAHASVEYVWSACVICSLSEGGPMASATHSMSVSADRLASKEAAFSSQEKLARLGSGWAAGDERVDVSCAGGCWSCRTA